MEFGNSTICHSCLWGVVSESNHPWKYFQYLRNVFSIYGIDNTIDYTDATNLKTIIQKTSEILINECLSKTSLNLYNDCFIIQGSQRYLEDEFFNRARLKLITGKSKYTAIKRYAIQNKRGK